EPLNIADQVCLLIAQESSEGRVQRLCFDHVIGGGLFPEWPAATVGEKNLFDGESHMAPTPARPICSDGGMQSSCEMKNAAFRRRISHLIGGADGTRTRDLRRD